MESNFLGDLGRFDITIFTFDSFVVKSDGREIIIGYK